jgi:hypothetical protein
MQRTTLMKTHIVLAAFILPVALMYFVSGALYTWGVKGGYENTDYELTLTEPLQTEHAILHDFVVAQLTERDIAVPSGHSKIKKGGTSYKFEWTGSALDVVLSPTFDPLKAKLTVKKTSAYRQLVQLHKAKGGTPFKVYAVVLVVSLLLLLLSGVMMAWQLPKYRPLLFTSLGAGVVVFAAMVMLS